MTISSFDPPSSERSATEAVLLQSPPSAAETSPPEVPPPPLPPQPRGRAPLMKLLALLAPVLALGISWIVLQLVGAGTAPTVLRRLLMPDAVPGFAIIPQAILFLFVWVLLDLTSRFAQQQKHSGQIAGTQRELQSAEAVSGALVRTRLDALQEGPVFRVFQALVEADGQSASPEHLRSQLDLQYAEAESHFGLAHLFIWAMPILGFIGTVVGIGLAVGGFSEFLQTDIDDIEVVKQGLAGVASGLAFAFDTTLLGLTASLIAMIATSLLQSRERAIWGRLEQFSLELSRRLAPAAPPARAQQTGTSWTSSMQEQERALQEAARRIEQACLRTTKDLVAGLEPIAAACAQLPISLQAETRKVQEQWAQCISTLGELEVQARRRQEELAELSTRTVQASKAVLARSEELGNVEQSHKALLTEVHRANELLVQIASHEAAVAQAIAQLEGGIEFRLASGGSNHQ